MPLPAPRATRIRCGRRSSSKLELEPVVARACHARSGARLSAAQSAAAALGQGWLLEAADNTIRVAAHSQFCLDIDGAKTTTGTPLITYTCNSISIHKVHNQQFEHITANNTLVSAMTGLCVTLGSKAVTMQTCAAGDPSQQWLIQAPTGVPPASTIRELVSASSEACLEWGGGEDSGSFVSQAYRLVERMAPFYAGVSGDQILVGCFGWLLDLVTEFKGEPLQPYPFVNRDAWQWSGGNATCESRNKPSLPRGVTAIFACD